MSKVSKERRVLGVVGSPRRNGNTETLVDHILTGASEAGASTEKVVLSELHISPCRACDSCQKTGTCIQKDDMQELAQKMRESDVWILGTPIYWWGPSAQFKSFLDRWYGLKQAEFRGKRVVTVTAMGGGASCSRHTEGMFSDILDYLGMMHVASVVASDVGDRGVVRTKRGIIRSALEAGRRAVED